MGSLFVSLLSLLALAAFARAQSVLGTYYIPSDSSSDGNDASHIVPEVSVIGVSTITDSGDIGWMTIQTVPNPTTSTTTEPACVLPLVALPF